MGLYLLNMKVYITIVFIYGQTIHIMAHSAKEKGSFFLHPYIFLPAPPQFYTF